MTVQVDRDVTLKLKLLKVSEDLSFHLFTIGMNLYGMIHIFHLVRAEAWNYQGVSCLPELNNLRHTS